MKMLTLNHADRLMNNNIVFNNIVGCADLAKQKTVAESAQCEKTDCWFDLSTHRSQ